MIKFREYAPVSEDSDLDAIELEDGEGEEDAHEEGEGQDKSTFKLEDFTQKGVYDKDGLDSAIQSVKDDFYNTLDSKKLIKRQGKVPFVEHMSMVNDSIVALPQNENIHNDLKREL